MILSLRTSYSTSAGKDSLPRPMVTDFGLSHGDEAKIGSEGRIGGTLTYMAPEQRIGDSGRIGVAADVYALGVVLYELLNGPRDCRRNSPGEEAVSSSPASLPPLPPVRSTTPRDLDATCGKCMRDDPDERYSSADEMAADLRCFLRGEAVSVLGLLAGTACAVGASAARRRGAGCSAGNHDGD